MNDGLTDDDFEIPKENIPPALLRVIIDMAAQQDAIFNLLVDYITKKGEIESEIMKAYVADFAAAKEDLRVTVFAEYGFDVNELLDESPSSL